jgi:hypothetical protein
VTQDTQVGYAVAHLDQIERAGATGEWIPIRRHFGIEAFGVNAWSNSGEGEQLVTEHDEKQLGHEELYVVVSGRALFTVGGEEIDAPAGTIVFVRDPETRRAAKSMAADTTILTVGAKPGEAFTPSPWEENADIFPLFSQGEYGEAKRRLEAAVAKHPEAAGLIYNLACAEARLGETDAAIGHLLKACETSAQFAEYAQTDPDLESIREDERFPKA